MPPEEQNQNQGDDAANEALVRNGMESNDRLAGVEKNTEASALRLNEIEQNQEAQIVQGQRNTEQLKEPLDTIAENTQPKDVQRMRLEERTDEDDPAFNENEAGKALWSMLRGPKGKTPQKGEDYFTNEEIKEFKEDVTPVKGTDYFTPQEQEQFKKAVTPKKGLDYFDGEKGEKGDPGTDARDPIIISRSEPSEPQIGDLWYKP